MKKQIINDLKKLDKALEIVEQKCNHAEELTLKRRPTQ